MPDKIASTDCGPSLAAATAGHAAQEMLSVKEVAKLLGMSTRHVWRWVGAGDLPAFDLDRAVRVARADLDAFLASRKRKTDVNASQQQAIKHKYS